MDITVYQRQETKPEKEHISYGPMYEVHLTVDEDATSIPIIVSDAHLHRLITHLKSLGATITFQNY